MKNITKILLCIGLLFLIIGTAYATQVDNLKAPNGYEEMIGGAASNLDDSNICIMVDKMEFNKDIFENTTSDYSKQVVTPVGEGIYKFVDTELNCCGVQEKVKLDGIEYVVYIEDDSGVDGDIDTHIKSMKEFNKINNIIPMTV